MPYKVSPNSPQVFVPLSHNCDNPFVDGNENDMPPQPEIDALFANEEGGMPEISPTPYTLEAFVANGYDADDPHGFFDSVPVVDSPPMVNDTTNQKFEKSSMQLREQDGRDWMDNPKKDIVAVNVEGNRIEHIAVEPIQAITWGDTLDAKIFTPLKWYIDKILPAGLCVFASQPKFGKTILVNNMVIAIANGEPFWGHETQQCRVLYLALEDSLRRARERIHKMNNGKTPANMGVVTISRNIDEGFEDMLHGYMKQFPDIGVVVVDVLQSVRGNKAVKGENVQQFDSREMQKLWVLADKYQIAIICVHHDSKLKTTNALVDGFSGSRGITSKADTLFRAAFKESGNPAVAILDIAGRDVENRKIEMRHGQKGTLKWEFVCEVDPNSPKEAPKESSKQELAEAWLMDLLTYHHDKNYSVSQIK